MKSFSDLLIKTLHHVVDDVIHHHGTTTSTTFGLLSQQFSIVCKERVAKNEKIYEYLKAYRERKNNAMEYIMENPLPDNDCKLVFLKFVRSDGLILEYASDDLKNDEIIVLAAVKEKVTAMQFASERLKTDRNFVLQALQVKPKYNLNSTLFEHLPYFHNDDEIAMLAIEQQPKSLQFASARLKNNREILLKAVKQDGGILEYVPEHLKDREMVLASTKNSKYCTLQFVPKQFLDDEEIVLSAANSHHFDFNFFCASQRLRSDRDFVLKIVKKKGDALKDVSKELKKDREIVYQAVKQSGRAIQYADPMFWNDKEIGILAVTKDVHSLSYLSELKEDREFILDSISGANNFFAFINYVVSDLANDDEFVDQLLDMQCMYSQEMRYNGDDFKDLSASRQERIVRIDPLCFEYLTDELKNDRKLVLDLVLADCSIMENLTEELKNDREIMRLAVKEYYRALEFASEKSQNDKELVLEAINYDTDNISCVSRELKMDPEIIEFSIGKEASCIELAPESWRRDREYVLKAIRNSNTNICPYLGYNLKEDRELILEQAKRIGSVLESIPEEFKQDREIVLAVIQVCGEDFRYASRSLQNDRELLIIALRNGFGLQYYKGELELDREIVYEAVRHNRYNLKHVPTQYRDDEVIIETIISLTIYKFQYHLLEIISERLKGNVEFMRRMAKFYGHVTKLIPKSLNNDREMFLNAVSQDSSTLEYASDELKKDREVILTALKQSADCYKFVPEEMQNDEQVLEALRKWLPEQCLKIPLTLNREVAIIALSHKPLSEFDYSLRNDRQFALLAVNANMRNLLYVSNRLKMDRTFILEIDTIEYDILFIPITLREDREIALRSIERNGKSIMFLSDELKNEFKSNREIMLKAIKSDAIAFNFASEELQNDEEFILEAGSLNGKVLQYVPLKFTFNRDIVLKCAQHNSIVYRGSLQFAATKFLSDKEIVMHAISHGHSSLNCIAFELRNDPEVVLRAVQHNCTSLGSASYELITNENFIAQTIDINIDALRFAHYSLRYNKDFLTRMNKNNRIVENASKQLKMAIDFDYLLKMNQV